MYGFSKIEQIKSYLELRSSIAPNPLQWIDDGLAHSWPEKVSLETCGRNPYFNPEPDEKKLVNVVGFDK